MPGTEAGGRHGSAVAALSIAHLSKTFPGQRALNDVGFEISAGEVHALIGQNGSGKSTLIKILAGYHDPDPGAVARVHGEGFWLGDAASAFAAGLRFVHQDLGLVPALGALDNLALGRGYRRGRFGTISWRRERIAARETLAELGYDFNLKTRVSDLTASERTGIAISRALEGWSEKVKILVLDEPTASLPAAEADRLLDTVRRVRDAGVAVVYVSHRFAEVLGIADRITVLRDGGLVSTVDASSVDEQELVRLTIGRSLRALERAHEITHSSDASKTALRVRGVSGRVVQKVDFDVHAGEIVGVAGVTGSGREEIADLVFGSAPRKGKVFIGDQAVAPLRPDASMLRGMALVPADRLAKAALRDLTVRENLTISRLTPSFRFFGLSRRRERRETAEWLDRLDVVPRDAEAFLMNLSGGNQQKVMLARALRLEPQVLILDEPTQGVDVGAKAAIYAIIRSAAKEGTAIFIVSTESEELIALCDRVMVLVDGRPVNTLSLPSEIDADRLTQMTMQTGRPPLGVNSLAKAHLDQPNTSDH